MGLSVLEHGLVSEVLPEPLDFTYANKVLDKKALSALIDQCYRKSRNKATVLLADRLRNTVGQLGYGAAREEDRADLDELDEGLLDTVHLAGARFERILKRLTGQERI